MTIREQYQTLAVCLLLNVAAWGYARSLTGACVALVAAAIASTMARRA